MVLFIIATVIGALELIDYYSFFYEDYNQETYDIIKVVFSGAHLRVSLILLIPVLGVFINKKIGWILITSYFYFIISNLILPFDYNTLLDSKLLTINIIALSILIFIITLMNRKKTYNLTYNIAKNDLPILNLISSVIGIAITLILVFLKSN